MLIISFFSVFIITGCTGDSEYRSLVKRELGTNIRKDTLLMDLRFGMDKREFFGHCWELHKKGVIREGVANVTIYFSLERFGKKYDVNFYPNFYEGKIVDLPVIYSYSAFAPWNPEFSLDRLLQEVLEIHMEEYGDDFIEIRSKNNEKGVAYVRVDGNRRISIYKNINKNSVTVFYLDLLSEKNTNADLEDI